MEQFLIGNFRVHALWNFRKLHRCKRIIRDKLRKSVIFSTWTASGRNFNCDVLFLTFSLFLKINMNVLLCFRTKEYLQ